MNTYYLILIRNKIIIIKNSPTNSSIKNHKMSDFKTFYLIMKYKTQIDTSRNINKTNRSQSYI